MELREYLEALVARWDLEGLPSRQGFEEAGAELSRWRERHGAPGLLGEPGPLLATATLDDGWGNGLRVVERLAEGAGLRVERLGLLVEPGAIVESCRRLSPALLGLTVLQLDSEDALAEVVRGVPPGTRVVAGGAAFRLDEELGERVGVHRVAADARAFLRFLLEEAGDPLVLTRRVEGG